MRRGAEAVRGCVCRGWSVGWRFEAGGRTEEEGRKARGLGEKSEREKKKGERAGGPGLRKKEQEKKKELGRGELG